MEQVTDHEQRAAARLIRQYWGKPSWTALAKLIGRRAQKIEDALWQLGTMRSLDDATGAQLDNVGAIVGEPRLGAIDADYRIRIGSRIRINLSDGTVEDVLGIVFPIVPSGATVKLTQYPPASLTVLVDGQPLTVDQAALIARFIGEGVAAGVGADLHFIESPTTSSEVFRLDVGPGLDVGKLAGAVVGA